MIRVLQIIASLEGSGGVQKRLLDNYMNMNRNEVVFDFIVHGHDSGELIPIAENMGSKVFIVTPKKESLCRNLLEIADVMKCGHYDIVQCHMEQASAFIIPIAIKYGIKVRIVHTHLAYIPASPLKTVANRIMASVINCTATDFWACSRDAGKWLFFKDRKDLRVIPNAIDVDKFKFDPEKRTQMREKMHIGCDECALVNVGRLTAQKNHSFMFRLVKELKKRKFNFKLFLIGDGELKEELRAESKMMEIDDKIVFLGTRNDVGDILQAMDVMIHPALFEGLGNVLIESQAAGLPVIASATGIPKETCITDIIQYVSTDDVTEWIAQILRWSKIQRTDKSDEVIKANFDVKEQGKNLQLIYEELLHNVKKSDRKK